MTSTSAGDPVVLLTRLIDYLLIEGGQEIEVPAGHHQSEAVVPTARLIAVVDGSLSYQIEGHTFAVQRDHRLLVHTGARRSWRAMEPTRLAWIEFSFTGMRTVPFSHHLVHGGGIDAAVEIARLLTDLRSPRPIDGMCARQAARLMLARFSAAMANVGDSFRRHEGSQAAIAAAAWIDAHHAREQVLAEARRAAGLSANRFRIAFRAATGCTPRDYLVRARLRAARLLLQQGQTVSAVASAVGFADPFYFSRAYRRLWGRPPLADRSAGP
ncbi:AraC family transcriptional regulator [Planctomycetota bacterium]|nr:AraC family transcriptional regulator [Planctomycetota bacterium]